jgi:hypothetical protein
MLTGPSTRSLPANPGAVVAQQQVVVRERGLAHERLRPRGGNAPVDEDNGLPASGELVLELDPVDGCALHHAGGDLGHGIAPDSL